MMKEKLLYIKLKLLWEVNTYLYSYGIYSGHASKPETAKINRLSKKKKKKKKTLNSRKIHFVQLKFLYSETEMRMNRLAERGKFHENSIPIFRVECLCTYNNLLNWLRFLCNKNNTPYLY